jgi:hypothetical protein
MKYDQLINAISAIESGGDAHSILAELKIDELAWLSDVFAKTKRIHNNLPDKKDKNAIITFIANILEKESQIDAGRERLPDDFITPSEHCKNLGLSDEYISDIRQILGELHDKAQTEGSLVVTVKDQQFDLKKEIVFGTTNNKNTYFSNRVLGPYVLERLHKLARPDPDTQLVPVTDFCTLHVKIRHSKVNLEKIRGVALELLENSLPFETEFPGRKIENYIGFYRSKPYDKVLFIHPVLKDLFRRHLDLLPEDLPDNLLTPSQHCEKLGLPAEWIGEIKRILGELHARAEKEDPAILHFKGQDFDLKKDILPGSTNNRPTFFSNSGLGPYLLERLDKLPMPPKQTELVPVTDFCRHHLKLTPLPDNLKKIRAAAAGLLENPKPFKNKFPKEDIKTYIATYRSAPHDVVYFIHPKLKDLFLQKLGIADVLPTDHAHLKSRTNTITGLGLSPSPERTEDLDQFLTVGLLAAPDRVVNSVTGRTLKESVLRYRNDCPSTIYLHDDIKDYLAENWLSRLTEPGKWATGQKLCKKLHMGARQERNEAIQVCLKEKKDTAWEQGVPCPQIRRFSVGGAGILYYISNEGIEAGMITKPEVLYKVEERERSGAGQGVH